MTIDVSIIEIVPFRDEFAPAFDQLSREWLERSVGVEPLDEKYLRAPRTAILDHGGQIFFAKWGSEILGTCAAIRHDASTIELAKLAVTGAAQGHGLGRRLCEAVLAFARDSGARRVILVSSSRLRAALRLYESLGFRYYPLPPDPGYATADRYMELELPVQVSAHPG